MTAKQSNYGSPLVNNRPSAVIYYLMCAHLLYFISVNGNCNFPSYLETDCIWMATYGEKGTLQGYFKRDKGIGYFKASRCNNKGICMEYQRVCLSKREDDKYEVQHNAKGASPHFLCMQIIRRSKSIIQIRESTKEPFRSPNACNDEQLFLDVWPMVTSEHFYSEKILCPFSGGYNIRLHGSDKQPICAKEMIPPRLECQCEESDGMTIDFHVSDCLLQELDMKIRQSLYCAATWTQGNFTFIILRPQEEDSNVWCMRIQGTDMTKPIQHGHLFIDFVCDPGDVNGSIRETSKYIYLEFERRKISSTCADSYSICTDPRLCNEQTYTIHCRKFCGYCSSDPDPCSFPGFLQGNWIESAFGEQKHVKVTYDSMHFHGAGRFQCNEKEGHNFANSTVLLQTFNNGCFPRFACLEVNKSSPSVLEYRLGKRISWPVKFWESLKNDVCDANMFQPNADEKLLLGKTITERPMKLLIDHEHHYSVNCEFDKWHSLFNAAMYIQEGDWCDACLIHDFTKHPKRIILNHLNCTGSSITFDRRDYNCLHVLPQDENTHAVVTYTLHVHHEYLCWVFVFETGEEDRIGRISILDASDCNHVTIKAMKEEHFKPKRIFIIPKRPSRQCPLHIGEPLTTTRAHNIFTQPHEDNEKMFRTYLETHHTSPQPDYRHTSNAKNISSYSCRSSSSIHLPKLVSRSLITSAQGIGDTNLSNGNRLN